MLTNKHVVLSHNYPLEASIVVVSFVTPGLRTRTLKFGQANSRASWTFWVLCTLEFAKMARSFPRNASKVDLLFGVELLK